MTGLERLLRFAWRRGRLEPQPVHLVRSLGGLLLAVLWLWAPNLAHATMNLRSADATWPQPVHITVEFKAWIPFDYVGDPSSPFSTPFESPVLDTPGCFDLPGGARGVKYKAFRGDAHVPYAGAYRLLESVSFTLGPYETSPQSPVSGDLSLVTSKSDVGPTHLDEVWQFGGERLGCSIEMKKAQRRRRITSLAVSTM
jgi:hypothetical protein